MTLDPFLQDLRHALRGLRRARAFSTTAVLTLAVGIAGVTAMFALVQGVLLRPLPIADQERVLVAWKSLPTEGLDIPFPPDDLDEIARGSQLLVGAAGVAYWGASPWLMEEGAEADYLTGAPVTGNFFRVLGVEAVLGRALHASDDVTGAENVMVIGHGLWQRRFGGAPDVIGRPITLLERSFTIVGVMPPGFEYPRGAEAWMTGAGYTSTITDPRFGPLYFLVGRMVEGVTLPQVAEELNAFIRRAEENTPAGSLTGMAPVVRSFQDIVVGDVRTAMLLLFGAVGLVLLIASANVANLLLMRGESRRGELAVRTALGAGRARIVRQLLQESVVLSLAAGVVGLAVAWGGLQAVVSLVPGGLPRVDSVRIDGTVALFTVLVACCAAALAGLMPALSSARTDPAAQLRAGGRGAGGGAARNGRRALVVTQVALAVTVVAAAGLLARSLVGLQSADTGIASHRLVFVEFALPQATSGDRDAHLAFLDEVVAELGSAPGIQGATPVNTPPFAGSGGWDAPIFVAEGQDSDEVRANPSLNLEAVHPSYFSTFEIGFVRGRAFTDADREGAAEVAIVSEDLAARTWPGGDPLGRRLKIGALETDQPWRTVVGVARPTRYRELAEPRPTLYLPARQFTSTANRIVLQTTAPIGAVSALARDRLAAIHPEVRVMRVASFEEFLAAPLARPRFSAFLLGIFGLAALLLAAVGLYAVMGTWVGQRSREIGVRIALGATGGDVRRLVLGEGLGLAGLGALLGLGGAALVTRLLESLLFGVHPLDPFSLLTAAGVLVGVSALACWLPTRRAMRVSPMGALRAE